MKKSIYVVMIALMITSIMLFSSCGFIVPNIATITVISDDDNADDGFIGFALKDIMVNYEKATKTTIAKGKQKDFKVQWWGGNQQDIAITYFIEIAEKKVYGNTSVAVRNFERIEKHIAHNNNKSPEVEYKK